MQSPITLSPVELSQNVNTNGKSVLHSTAPVTPFHQVLNKEMAHQNTNAPNKANNSNSGNNPKTVSKSESKSDSQSYEKVSTPNTNATSAETSTAKPENVRAEDDSSSEVTPTDASN